MSITGLFNIGKTAIMTSQAALAVTSNNIANVNTPGFSRQEVILGISTPVQSGGQLIGSGVTLEGIRRSYDSFLQTQLIGQSQNQGRSAALDKALSEVEQVLNDAGGTGISSAMTEFFNAWQEVSANPEGLSQRNLLIQKTNSLILSARTVEQGMTDTISRIDEEVGSIVTQVNDIATKIAALNEQIVKAEAGQPAGTALEFRDQRDSLLSDLANLVDTSSYENQDGSLTVLVGSGTLVTAAKANHLTSTEGPDGAPQLFLENRDITPDLTKGQLGGFLSARNDITENPLTDFRMLIASLVKEVNLRHQAGYGLDGTTGKDFFSPLSISTSDFSSGADMVSASISDLSQVTLDEYNITFDGAGSYFVSNAADGSLVTSGAYLSGNPISFEGLSLTISGSVSASDRFFVSPLTDAVRNFSLSVGDGREIAAASTAAGLPGDGSNALALAQLNESPIAELGDSFNDFYRSIVSYTGTASKAASDSLSFDNSLSEALSAKRDSVSGVSLDEEAINMIRFQRSFEAAARMISVTDELMQTILNL